MQSDTIERLKAALNYERSLVSKRLRGEPVRNYDEAEEATTHALERLLLEHRQLLHVCNLTVPGRPAPVLLRLQAFRTQVENSGFYNKLD